MAVKTEGETEPPLELEPPTNTVGVGVETGATELVVQVTETLVTLLDDTVPDALDTEHV
jgi:hypothetical protein